jgi:hypothetical protein
MQNQIRFASHAYATAFRENRKRQIIYSSVTAISPLVAIECKYLLNLKIKLN